MNATVTCSKEGHRSSKSFLIEDDAHLLSVCRYVERNAARAGLFGSGGRAEDWRWSSLWRWRYGDAEAKAMLSPWPISASGVDDPARFNRPRQWLRTVNTPISEAELKALRLAARRGGGRFTASLIERLPGLARWKRCQADSYETAPDRAQSPKLTADC